MEMGRKCRTSTPRWLRTSVSWLILAVCFGLMSPALGVTPREPDPHLSELAPESCLIYVQNFGVTAPNGESENNTERLAAEPDVQKFIKAVDQLVFQAVRKWAAESGGELDPATAEMIYEWGKYASSHPSMAYLARLELAPDGGLRDIEAGIVCRLDERLEEARRLILDLQSRVPVDRLKSVEIAGEQVTEVAMAGGPPVYWVTRGSHLYVTVGAESMARLWQRTGKASPPWLEASKAQLSMERRWGITHIDGAGLTKVIQQLQSSDLAATWSALGMDRLRSIGLTSGLEEKGCLTRLRIVCDRFDGVFAGIPSHPLLEGDLASVPADVHMAFVSRLDGELILETIVRIVNSIEPRAAQRLEMELAQLTQVTGIRVREDLLKSLGDTVVVYQNSSSFILLPELIVRLAVKDSKRMEAVNARIIALAKQALASRSESGGGRIEIVPTSVEGIAGNSLKGIPIAVTWVITDDALIIATSPQTLKTHLLSQGKNPSLATQPQISRLLKESEGTLTIVYSDTRAGLKNAYPTLQMLANMGAGQLSQNGLSFDTATIPSLETISKYIEPSVVSMHRRDDGIEWVSRETLPQTSATTLGTPTAVALLLPAVQAARHTARRTESMNNIKQLSIAVLNYEAAQGRLPTATMPVNGQGKEHVQLSWRVAVLPYLGHEALYREFHLDEAWDSEHNKKLIPRMPEVYRSPFSASEAGKTNYLAVRGERCVIREKGEGCRLSEITDGTSNTVWVVEADDDQAQVWTKPDDFAWNPKNPAAGLGRLQNGPIMAGFVDGSVRIIPSRPDAATLRALFTRDGGEVVDLQRY